MEFDKKITVIIINYKTSHLINELLYSIKEEFTIVSILIVDNSSTNESYNDLKSINDPRLSIIRSEKNLGFTGGINFALQHLDQINVINKYFALFNPDALSSTNLLGNLIGLLEENPDSACISPRIVNLKGEPWYSGAEINFEKGEVINIPIRNMVEFKRFYEVDAFSGCASVFNLEMVKETGMFNEDLFMYFDEAEYSIKLKKKGFKILYAPDYMVFHDVSYTTKDISHIKTYYMTRNKFIVFNGSMKTIPKIHYMIHLFIFYIKKGKYLNAFYHLKGFYHYKLKKIGKLDSN